VSAIVAFDYEHHEVIRDLHDVQHDFQDVVETTSHTTKVSGVSRWCSATGTRERVRQLVYGLRDFDAVGRVKVLSLRR